MKIVAVVVALTLCVATPNLAVVILSVSAFAYYKSDWIIIKLTKFAKSLMRYMLRELMRLSSPLKDVFIMNTKARDVAKTIVPEQIHITYHRPTAELLYITIGSLNNIPRDRGEDPIGCGADEE